MLSHAPLRNIVADPALTARVSNAAAEILGEPYGNLVSGVLQSVLNDQMSLYMARILFERCLPQERPTPVVLPLIDCAADVLEADRRLMAAANVGSISHKEWAQAQQCIEASYRIRCLAKLEEP
jgi:hypothetical protein